MEVFAPLDANEIETMLPLITASSSPSYIRLVRPDTPTFSQPNFQIGKANILQTGSKITIIGYGPVLFEAFKIENAEIINCSSIKPLDEKTIIESVKKTKNLLIIEDHQKNCGLVKLLLFNFKSKLIVNFAISLSTTNLVNPVIQPTFINFMV